MNSRERAALDRYITGDGGERQFASRAKKRRHDSFVKDRHCERCKGLMGKMSFQAWADLGGICETCNTETL